MFEELSFIHILPLLKGALVTIHLCVFATILGLVLGFLVGLGSTAKNKIINHICKIYVDIIRGIPLLVILFMVYFGIPMLIRGTNVSQSLASIGGLTIYAGAYIGEIVRGSILAVDRGQVEAATALGMNYVKRNIYIILPQAVKIMIPALVGFLIALVKDSSLVSVIGYIDLTKAGKIVGNITVNPLATFSIVAVLYFIICFGLSRVAGYCEGKLKG